MNKIIERDVIVVGAGPGGSTCAAYLAREGVDVLLIDKETFPRDKACGDSQAAVTMEHVKELGAYEEVEKVGFRNKGFLLTSPDYTKAYLDAPGERFTTPRRIFDNIMKNTAVRCGAEMLEDCWVYDVIKEDGQVKGVKAKYQGEYVEFRSKIVIGADGAHSVVARAIDMFPDNPVCTGAAIRCYYENVPLEDYLEVHFDKNVLPGYIWVFPSGNRKGIANVGIGINLDVYESKTLKEYIDIFIESNPFGKRLKNARQISEWKGWRLPSGPQATENYAAGVMLIGDAGSMILPLTGEGVGPTTETAKMAADTALDALKADDFSAEFLKAYADKKHNAYDVKYKSIMSLDDVFRSPENINGIVKRYNLDPAFKEQVLKQMFFAQPKK